MLCSLPGKGGTMRILFRMFRGRAIARISTIAASLAILLVCCAITTFVGEGGGPSGAAGNTDHPRVTILRELPAAGVRSIAFSPSGAHFHATTAEDTIYVYTCDGARCYSVKQPGANRLVTSPDGRYALAYSERNPADSMLTFLDSEGRVFWQMEVSGAVWSAGVCGAGDGARFVAGTGSGYVYVIDIGEVRRKYKRWRVPGSVVSVSISADGEAITYGTWQKSAIGRADAEGKREWGFAADPGCLHYVEPLNALDRILIRSIPNRSATDGAFALLDDSGDRIFTGTISSSEHTRVLPAPNGRYICLGCSKLIEHKGKSTRERHMVLLDGLGKKVCEKGSLFFQANPILVTSRGCVLLSDGKGALFTVDPSGEIQPSIKIPAPVERSAHSRDGSRALLQCTNGSLYLIKVSQ